jgi:hypothetical protein
MSTRNPSANGTVALASTHHDGDPCRLSLTRQARLAIALDSGPSAYGWSEDQRWTLARMIGRLLHVSYTSRVLSAAPDGLDP